MASSDIQKYAEQLKALAHPTRLQIVMELQKGTKCVTDIQELLPASQANISQHLTVLRHAGLVDFAQDGAQRCYYLARPQMVQSIVASLFTDEPALRKSKQDITSEKELACGVCCGA